ncbi:MAG: PASTA domain-containing protein [Bacteroidales bacterium]|nr:PASTA domain-containing protein [Bacteroidales bacterium]
MEQENNSSFMDYLKAWGRFFISRYFIKNICIFIATVLVFILLITQGLKWYTHHTEKISVPSVEGMTVAEAKKIIKERGLEAVVNDSTFECASKSIKPGQIIPGGQQPTPGYQVKKGRKIYLTYLAYTKQPATMPNINGESVETAKSLILGAGLIPGKITEREHPHKGLVLEAKFNGARVSAGKQLHKGDIIDLIIGKGEDNDATTPYSESDTDVFNQTDDSDEDL